MSEWRERGYVSDSDEEILQDSNPLQGPGPGETFGDIQSQDRSGQANASSQVDRGGYPARDEQQEAPEADDGAANTSGQESSRSAVWQPDSQSEKENLPSLGKVGEPKKTHADTWTDLTNVRTPARTYGRRGGLKTQRIRSSQPLNSTTTGSPPLQTVEEAVQSVHQDLSSPLSSPQTPGIIHHAPHDGDSAEVQDVDMLDESSSLPEVADIVGLERTSSSPALASSPPILPATRTPTLPADHTSQLLHTQQLSPGRALREDAQMAANLAQSGDLPGAGRTRALRPRTAIQLHPYKIDSDLFHRTMRARGMATFRVNLPEDNRDRQQQVTRQGIEREPSSSPFSLSPPRYVASPSPQPTPTAEHASEDDEFPDVDRVLQRKVSDGIQHGFKRRKLTANAHTWGRADQTFSEPPTPPTTSAASSTGVRTVDTAHFRLPRGLSPIGVVTPRPSSPGDLPVAHSPKQTRRTDNKTCLSSPEARRRTPGQSSSDSASGNEVEFQTVRKRIKGVLPASWLRLDNKAQSKGSPVDRAGLQQRTVSGVASSAKGVAQRRSIHTPNDEGHGVATKITRIDLSSDTSSESEEEEESRATPLPVARRTLSSQTPRKYQPRLARDVDMGSIDDMEDNAVDSMLAGGPSRRRMGKSKKHQLRIADAFERSQKAGMAQKDVSKSSRASTTDMTNSTSRGKRVRATSNRPPALSILDRPPPAPNRPIKEPLFLRLATRQARRHGRSGRHSPTTKAIRLATREDTEDALSTLSEWRSGHIRPRQRPLRSAPRAENMDEAHEQPDMSEMAAEKAAHSRKARGATSSIVRIARRPARLQYSQDRPQDRMRQTRIPDDVDQDPIQLPPHHNREPFHQQGRLLATARDRPLFRAGQLEAERSDVRERTGRIYGLQQIFARVRNVTPAPNLQLDRFLQEHADSSQLQEPSPIDPESESNTAGQAPMQKLSYRLRRKVTPTRLDTETVAYRQPNQPLPSTDPISSTEAGDPLSNLGLQELGSFGTHYSTDFDVRPLEIGTYFHQSSFLGSGDFDDALTLRGRELDAPAGHITVDVSGDALKWSAWNEQVSDGLTKVLRLSQDGLQVITETESSTEGHDTLADVRGSLTYLLRSIVRYFSGCLSFSDPIDRQPCVMRFTTFVEDYLESISETQQGFQHPSPGCVSKTNVLVDLMTYLICVASQIVFVAQHPSIERTTRMAATERLHKLCRVALSMALPDGFRAMRTFYEDMRRHTKRAAGASDDAVAVKLLIVLNHTLSPCRPNGLTLPELLKDQFAPHRVHTNSIKALDQVWYDMVTTQPLLEIDARGVFRPGARYTKANDNWPLAKSVLERVFVLYPNTTTSNSASLNGYIRQTLIRVYVLLNRWQWRRCELVLGTVYDFFATRGLAPLSGEDDRGSPRFLDGLDNEPTLQPEPGDAAFHIFCKILATGLRSMPTFYATAKLKRIAYRFVPNHGRTYRKDEEVRQADIDALRNHHDILCTLYCALPHGCRPRLDYIKELVDFQSSHQEACRININAWKFVAKHILSRDGQEGDIVPLADWFKELSTSTIAQYRLARSEAEELFELGKTTTAAVISYDTMQMTVSSNQRRILNTLLNALAAMQESIREAQSYANVRLLVQQSNLVEYFKLFDASQPKSLPVVLQGLVTVKQFLDLATTSSPSHAPEVQQASEESQDYGDWEGLDEEMLDTHNNSERANFENLDFLHHATYQLLSSCFGADTNVDDDLAGSLLGVWCVLAAKSVCSGTATWTKYLDTYSPESWFQLRDTDHKHKWTPYFLSLVLSADHDSFHEHRHVFVGALITSLVDRESMLKFQHMLASRMLNLSVGDGLFENLPFAANRRTGLFDISLSELRTRRLSLLGCLLLNMRTTWDQSRQISTAAGVELRRDFARILKQIMAAMRQNYQELQAQEQSFVDPNARGSYVGFVQSVISLMQQYTSEICAIDNFFTDSASSAFPLPSSDPAYIIGRLKSYVPKLADSRARKQLVAFVQNIIVKATTCGQEDDLVQQLHAAMTLTTEETRIRGPLLRDVFLTAILPAYIETAVGTDCGWVMALPLVQACTLAMGDMLFDCSANDRIDASCLGYTLTWLLERMHHAINRLFTQQDWATPPEMLQLLASMFTLVRASITPIDYIERSSGHGKEAVALLQAFWELGRQVQETLTSGDEVLIVDAIELPQSLQWEDTLDYSRKGMKEELTRNWRRDGGVTSICRGGRWQTVVVDLGVIEEETEHAIAAVASFMNAYGTVFGQEKEHSDLAQLAWLVI